MDRHLLTLSQAAKMLSVEPGTLRAQVWRGKLKAEKIGEFWVVEPSEVERYRAQSQAKRQR